MVQKLKRVSCHFKDCLLWSTGVHRPDIEPQTTSKKAGEQKQFGRRGPEEGADSYQLNFFNHRWFKMEH